MTSASLDGLDDFLRALKKSAVDVDDLKAVNKSAADVVLETAKVEVPRRSGKLRKSGRTSGTKSAGVARFGRKSVPYAGPIHFGHADRPQGGYVRPVPFLYDALDKRTDEVVARYEEFVARTFRNNGL